MIVVNLLTYNIESVIGYLLHNLSRYHCVCLALEKQQQQQQQEDGKFILVISLRDLLLYYNNAYTLIHL